ncbi:CRISPR system Cascade subunit CasC [Mobiluncus mulieris]|uniref:CRISPR-associated protein Cas7/Cse4/CasC, subtype I-E/ECOLI n=1 Tax=Mobiluncus mulieris TaxID=2052 RepID=A0A8G2HVM8_9ACTO|nr:type I-E CRISPR-associated protein Cas7/Cse4/CasC [Mobiluncus mulieris]MBB5846389.1 CRISPR system Cascade subunit CasC [Mobiluncus mulieris]MCV0012171.1 type I-E CRISPR-associated protein Cas7/Cse4/CasC [Mobiluncus mulieris]STO17130.1 CRISPR-associated protein Cas7/Cse4/CasC, subtype I-E/ECOLI [Mobiluncus mulieris]
MSNLLTIHILNSIPWSNLNRDDTGTPKRLIQGGVLRGQLSSQSIKRAARSAYENVSQDISVRSGNLAEMVIERALELNPKGNKKDFLKSAKKAIGALTKNDDSSKKRDSARSTWLSGEELEACAKAIAQGKNPEFMEAGKTGSLAIAAFGRMFASAPGMNTESAIAVSPAVSTHQAIIETDYYNTTDDAPLQHQGAGATFLGMALYTSGCFYRTVTIDKAQLRKSWTGFDSESAHENLAAMVDALIYALPRGKKNSTAPYVMPALLLAEEQAHRIAYDFEKPIQASNEGGFIGATVDELLKQYQSARRFDPDNFAGVNAISGTCEEKDIAGFNLKYSNKSDFINKIVDWIQA